jgi:hypothetical protein
VTRPRKHIGILPGLPWAARKYLLGARPYYGADERLRNSGIVRLQHLIVRARSEEDWQRYLAELQREYGPLVREKRAIWRQRKALARQAAKQARQRVTAPAMTVRTAPLAKATISWATMGP